MSTMPPAGLVLAPVSPALAALIHQIHAEATEAAQAAMAPAVPPAGAIVLAPHDFRKLSAEYGDSHGQRWLLIKGRDRYGDSYQLHTPHLVPEWARESKYYDEDRPGTHTPGVWSGSERRLDADNRAWESHAGCYADDGFGELIEVRR